MTDKEDKATGSLSVADALKMFERYKGYWEHNYREAMIDLKMIAGDKETQWGAGWDSNFQTLPTNKPCIVVNQLPQFTHQVINDIRQNTPSVKIIPATDADLEDAEVREDLIRDIQQKSAADEVYDTAAEYAVKSSIGFIRVDHQYCDDNSGLQELVLKRVPDPLSNYLDPASIECDGRDANGAICLEPINKEDFEKLYPGKSFISFTDHKNRDEKEAIVLGEVFIKEVSGEQPTQQITIHRYKFSGEEQLAYTTFPGNYVPLVPVYGEESWVDGKRVLASLIRQARDPQRRLNHWASKESELLAMAPTAPVMAEEGTLVNERGQWQKPGSEMVLEYRRKNLDDEPAQIPQRLSPPPIPTGIINAMEGAKENIREAMGIYNAGLGKREGDASGIALNRLQKQGDVATFHFADNLRRSVNQVGRILVSCIPVIYDTPRILQVVNEEEEPQSVGVNGAAMQKGQERPFDLTKGTYHVRVSTGASYATKRQESAAFLSDLFKQSPAFMQIGGDILLKNLDLPGAQALAARVKKTIPPQLLDDSKDPQVMALQQELQKAQGIIQQGAQALQQLQEQIKSKDADTQVKMADLQIKQQELQVRGIEGQVKLAQLQQPQPAINDNQPSATELHDADIKERELAVKEYDAETKRLQVTQKVLPDPLGIKLDTTGFQVSKTPEQIAMEAQQSDADAQTQMLQAQREEQERQEKQGQTMAIIQSLSTIAQQLNQLTSQVAKPKEVIRDKNGAIVGVS